MLRRLGLHRPELRAWAMYDWANSAVQTTIIAAVFPIYFKQVAADGWASERAESVYAYASAAAILIVAVIAPVLGAMADARPLKKPLLGIFMAIGAVACGGMYWIERGDATLALTLFIIVNVAVAGSIVFYESLLPHIAAQDEMDQVSTSGYAMGYVGGGLLLAINLTMIQQPQWFGIPDSGAAVRWALVSVGIWWVAFSIPLFRGVREPQPAVARGPEPVSAIVAAGFRQLGQTFRELRRYRDASIFLLAFFIYNDGVQTMIRMAAIYGEGVGIGSNDLITALLLVQFVGIPCSFFFGMLATRIGAKAGIYIGLTVYLGIAVFAYWMHTATQFYMLAIAVGLVQGGTQALSRSLFASMIPRQKSSEFFAFFSVFERYAGVLGPLLFAWVAGSGSSRNAILSLVIFFGVGIILLRRVDVAAGQRTARAAEAGPAS